MPHALVSALLGFFLFFGAVLAGLGGVLDEERRLEEFLDERVLRHHLAELGAGGKRPVDAARGALRIGEADRPGMVLLVLDGFGHFELEFVGEFDELRVQGGQLFGNFAAVFRSEVRAMGELGAGQHLGELFVADALVDFFDEAEIFVEGGHEAGEIGAFDAACRLAVAHDHAFGGAIDHDLDELAVVLDVLLEAALLDFVKRRLSDVDVIALDELGHVAEEKGEQQGADVRAVHVGVGHENDFAVADLGGVEVLFADAAAERGDHGADFLVAEHLVVAGFFDVEDFALEGKDGLEFAIAALLGGAAGAFALDEIKFAAVGIALAAVGELAGKSAAVERALAASQIAGLARSFASAGGLNGLVDDAPGDGRILFEIHAEALIDERLHGAGDIGVELALGLAFELRLRTA